MNETETIRKEMEEIQNLLDGMDDLLENLNNAVGGDASAEFIISALGMNTTALRYILQRKYNALVFRQQKIANMN